MRLPRFRKVRKILVAFDSGFLLICFMFKSFRTIATGNSLALNRGNPERPHISQTL